MPERPSRTSTLVAFMRGIADAGITQVNDFHDPTASVLLPPPFGGLTRLAAAPIHRVPAIGTAMWWMTAGGLDMLPLRTRAIDDAWVAAHQAGARQLVLLGAGLDGRAHRLPGLEDTRVFELDRAGTQAVKRARAERLPTKAKALVYVPIDLATDDLAVALDGAGYDRKVPAFFLLEGVTPYLPASVTRETLEKVASLMAPGSRFAVTYIPPKRAVEAGALAALHHIMGRLGEPFVGLLPADRMAAFVREAGLEVADDSGLADWVSRYARRGPVANGQFEERMVVARKS